MIPELHARVTAARAAQADFQGAAREYTISGTPGDWLNWALRLAAELDSVASGLWSALSELESASLVLDAQEESGLMTTGAVSVSVADTADVLAALADAAEYRSGIGDQVTAMVYRDLAARLRVDL